MWNMKIAAPNPVKLIQAITMISQMIRNTVQPMKMKDIGLYFVILKNIFVQGLKYTQSPIIRTGPIRLSAEFWGKFKTRALGSSNLRTTSKN